MKKYIWTGNLKCGYQNRIVLSGLNITIYEGEFIGIIGPNSSGKSTFLKTIGHILKPLDGIVCIKDYDISKIKSRELARTMAGVLQETEIEYSYTVLDIVLMGRNPHLGRFQLEREGDYKIAMMAMEMTDTVHLSSRLVNELSGGERQRVVIARALAQEPKILLLDEPTSHLDINHQIEIYDLLRRLISEKNITILMVSHDLNIACEYCSRLFLINEGRIFADGYPADVLTEINIKTVYGIEVLIEKNPISGAPIIIPFSKNRNELIKKGRVDD